MEQPVDVLGQGQITTPGDGKGEVCVGPIAGVTFGLAGRVGRDAEGRVVVGDVGAGRGGGDVGAVVGGVADGIGERDGEGFVAFVEVVTGLGQADDLDGFVGGEAEAARQGGADAEIVCIHAAGRPVDDDRGRGVAAAGNGELQHAGLAGAAFQHAGRAGADADADVVGDDAAGGAGGDDLGVAVGTRQADGEALGALDGGVAAAINGDGLGQDAGGEAETAGGQGAAEVGGVDRLATAAGESPVDGGGAGGDAGPGDGEGVGLGAAVTFDERGAGGADGQASVVVDDGARGTAGADGGAGGRAGQVDREGLVAFVGVVARYLEGDGLAGFTGGKVEHTGGQHAADEIGGIGRGAAAAGHAPGHLAAACQIAVAGDHVAEVGAAAVDAFVGGAGLNGDVEEVVVVENGAGCAGIGDGGTRLGAAERQGQAFGGFEVGVAGDLQHDFLAALTRCEGDGADGQHATNEVSPVYRAAGASGDAIGDGVAAIQVATALDGVAEFGKAAAAFLDGGRG